MVCEMESDSSEDVDTEILPSMWPEDVGPEVGKQFNVERPGGDQDMLKEVNIIEEPSIVDFKRLLELTNYTEKGSSQLKYLAKQWEHKQANAVRLLKEELDILCKQRKEVETKKLEILEEHRFEEETYGGDKRPVSILDEVYDIWDAVAPRKPVVFVQNKKVEVDAEYDTVTYWKQRALQLERLLEESIQRENLLLEKLQESIKNLEKQSSPVEELSDILKRADNFLHFVLQNAPVVIGHQDKELRYRFIYNHFPSLQEEDILGRTDVEIFTGAGVKESQDFKREVLEKGLAAKREITFDTPLFGLKTFLIYVEPVFSKAGETIGINYMGMEISDQVKKREKMAKIGEELAVQRARETELSKSIHITEETMRAKQLLATMSHEIRSPLSGVVSMAEILSTTKLDPEQRQLLDVMLSSGDLVLQLINDILDLSKVESGAMRIEATKFRPREVVKHVLQTAAASLRKFLTLEGRVAEDVPVEVIGDVLRFRQILTNLISNGIKFTHQGKVGIKLYVVPEPSPAEGESHQNLPANHQAALEHGYKETTCQPASQTSCGRKVSHGLKPEDGPHQNQLLPGEPKTPSKMEALMNGDEKEQPHSPETTVWIRCDVYDTGIGIPESALPTLFKRYMQVSVDHARKYGGTGLGLAICKQLAELMGGYLTVSSRENRGSTFTFTLPYQVLTSSDLSDDFHELSEGAEPDAAPDDTTEGFFQFQPRSFGSLSSSNGSSRSPKLLPHDFRCKNSKELNGSSENSYYFTSNNIRPKETDKDEDGLSVGDKAVSTSLPSESSQSHSLESHGEKSICGGSPCQEGTIGESQSALSDSPHKMGTTGEEAPVAEAIGPQRILLQQENSSTVSQNITSASSEIPQSLEPKILLVEDNKTNIMVTRSMMKKLGYTIEVVTNGVEAVRAVQHQFFDLILMDVSMPVMDGLEATRLIRSFEETGSWEAAAKAGIEQIPLSHTALSIRKRIPIIAMTANAMAESEEECIANGMDSLVSKPVTFQKLKQCLEQYLP